MIYRSNRIKLNAGWRFHFENDDWEDIHLPHTWNALDTMSTDPDFYYRRGTGIYEKDFIPSPDTEGQKLWLEFEAVAQRATIYFDNELIGEHHGGYTAFTVEIPNRVGTIRIEADNSPDSDLIPSDLSDFFLYGGITRNVWLYATDRAWVEAIRCDIDANDINAKLKVNLTFGGDFDRIAQFAVNLQGIGFHAEYHEDIDGGIFDKEITVEMPLIEGDSYKKWSPDHPNLYQLTVSLYGYGIASDEFDTVEEKIGLRRFDFPEYGAFYLNGERLLLRGTHRHEDWAGHGGAVPDEITRQEFQLMKDAGFNFVRLGHYPQSRAALEACDELGIIVWEEIPWCRGGLGGDVFKAHTRNMLHEMITQHYNHPSIIFWGMGNELDWISEHPDSNDDKVCEFLQELHDTSHKLDPSRLTALRRFDYGADIVDVYSPSIWAGWYRGKYTDYEQNLRDALAKFPRLLHAEWGGDSHAGRFREAPHIHEAPPSTIDNAEVDGTAISDEGFTRYSKDGDWSESYILKLMNHHLMVQNKLDNFAGSLQWAFKDFGTPLRPENPVPYVNQKGLVDRQGNPKASYYVFKAWQTDNPFCQIIDQTVRTKNDKMLIPVITNCDAVQGFINNGMENLINNPVTDVEILSTESKIIELGYPIPNTSPNSNDLSRSLSVDGIGQDGVVADDYRTHIFTWWYRIFNRNQATQFSMDLHVKASRLDVFLQDEEGKIAHYDEHRVHFTVLSGAKMLRYQGHMGASDVVETANGRAWVKIMPDDAAEEVTVRVEVENIGIKEQMITLKRLK